MLDYPTLLGQPAPRLRVYPMPVVVAEKLEAIFQLGMLNSRMKISLTSGFWPAPFRSNRMSLLKLCGQPLNAGAQS